MNGASRHGDVFEGARSQSWIQMKTISKKRVFSILFSLLFICEILIPKQWIYCSFCRLICHAEISVFHKDLRFLLKKWKSEISPCYRKGHRAVPPRRRLWRSQISVLENDQQICKKWLSFLKHPKCEILIRNRIPGAKTVTSLSESNLGFVSGFINLG